VNLNDEYLSLIFYQLMAYGVSNKCWDNFFLTFHEAEGFYEVF